MEFETLVLKLNRSVKTGETICFTEEEADIVNKYITSTDKITANKLYKAVHQKHENTINIALTDSSNLTKYITDIIAIHVIKYPCQTITSSYQTNAYIDTRPGIVGLEDALKYYINQPNVNVCVSFTVQNNLSQDEINSVFALLVKYSRSIDIGIEILDEEIYTNLVKSLINSETIRSLSILMKMLKNSAKPGTAYEERAKRISNILAILRV